MNTAERFAASTAKIEDLQTRFDKLFAQCNAECKGMNVEDSNKIWRTKYKSRYDAIDRLMDAAMICHWYTNPTISRQSKLAKHRAVVYEMRHAGLHRMKTPIDK